MRNFLRRVLRRPKDVPTEARVTIIEQTEPETLWGYQCPDCRKAMFYWARLPKAGQPITRDDFVVKEGVHRPCDDGRVQCQWCGSRWTKLNLTLGGVRKFKVETGEVL